MSLMLFGLRPPVVLGGPSSLISILLLYIAVSSASAASPHASATWRVGSAPALKGGTPGPARLLPRPCVTDMCGLSTDLAPRFSTRVTTFGSRHVGSEMHATAGRFG